jgi:hypothetical protein
MLSVVVLPRSLLLLFLPVRVVGFVTCTDGLRRLSACFVCEHCWSSKFSAG